MALPRKALFNYYTNLQMLCKLFTLPQFVDLVEADKILLTLNCWHRLLLWIYAEQKFSFKVTHLPEFESQLSSKESKAKRINQPSMAFVKCKLILCYLHISYIHLHSKALKLS